VGADAARLGVRLHGVTLTLEAERRELIEYAREHLHGLVAEPVPEPDFLVRCHWSEGEWDPASNPFPAEQPLSVAGNRMLAGPDELVWLDTLRMKGLKLRFRRVGGRFVFDVAFRLRQRKGGNPPGYEYKKYFSLMSYLVYHPLLWYLETYRRWTVLHASVVDSPAGGIVIGGLGGVGKSTTAVALIQRPGLRLLSENLALTDGEFVYPCYEPVRLGQQTLALVGGEGLTPMTFPDSVKEKAHFHVATADAVERVPATLLVLPRFAPARYLKPLTPELAAAKVAAMNGLVRELDDYRWHASALDVTWPLEGRRGDAQATLRRLTERAACFELGIDRRAGVDAVVDDILGALPGAGVPTQAGRR